MCQLFGGRVRFLVKCWDGKSIVDTAWTTMSKSVAEDYQYFYDLWSWFLRCLNLFYLADTDLIWGGLEFAIGFPHTFISICDLLNCHINGAKLEARLLLFLYGCCCWWSWFLRCRILLSLHYFFLIFYQSINFYIYSSMLNFIII